MSTAEHESRLYGGWRRPSLQGFAGLSLGVSVLLLVGGLTTAMLIVMHLWGTAVVTVGVTLLLAVVLTVRVPVAERTIADLVMLRTKKSSAIRSGRAFLAQGPAGFTPDGRCRLPGLMASSEMYSCIDSLSSPFGLLRVPKTDHWSVVIQCSPPGLPMTDEKVVDQHVAGWSEWLGKVGQDHRDVAGVQVCVESAPDPGVRLRRAIDQSAAADRPAFVVEAMEQVKQRYPHGQARIATKVVVTFRAKVGGHTRSADEMQRRIGNVLPALVSSLQVTGAGQAPRAMTAQEITDATRVAFDPAVAEMVERAQAEDGGTGLAWLDAGPAQLDDRHAGVLMHDRALSMSWQMAQPPRNVVRHDVLARLLAPHSDVALKRVTLLYRPMDTERSARAADMAERNASFAINNSRRVTEREKSQYRQARQAMEEESRGAVLVNFGMIVTATVINEGEATSRQIEAARSAVRELSASARVRLRPATYLQAAVFTAGLPLGLVLPEHVATPSLLKEAL